MKVKGGFSEYFASLKDANDPKSMQEIVLGSAYQETDALSEAFQIAISNAEDAGDNNAFALASEVFRKGAVLAWALEDSRMVETLSTQALYYCTLTDFETLIKNSATAWSLLAHMLPGLKPGERSRLQDFARFRRSFELGLRIREKKDKRINAAIALIVPTFDKLGAINLKGIDDSKQDLTDEVSALWDEVSELMEQFEKLED